MINEKTCKIFETAAVDSTVAGDIGSYTTDGKTFLYFQTGLGVLSIISLQMEGKKRMAIDEFLRGNRLS
jgi:methionyl-tRNA formyltransferase